MMRSAEILPGLCQVFGLANPCRTLKSLSSSWRVLARLSNLCQILAEPLPALAEPLLGPCQSIYCMRFEKANLYWTPPKTASLLPWEKMRRFSLWRIQNHLRLIQMYDIVTTKWFWIYLKWETRQITIDYLHRK